MSIIEMKDVVKKYGNGTTALRSVSINVEPGEFAYIVGPSGAGKSTFIRLLYREIKLDKGSLKVADFDLAKIKKRDVPMLRRQVGVVFQDYKLLPKKTVYENIAYAMEVIGERRRNIKKRVMEVLDLVGLKHKVRSFPNELSGGEQQRLRVAQALANDPKILLADEALLSLDLNHQYAVAELIHRFNRDHGLSVVFVTHEINPIIEHVDRVLYLANGRFTVGAVDEVMQTQTLSELYGTPVNVLKSNGRYVIVGQGHSGGTHLVEEETAGLTARDTYEGETTNAPTNPAHSSNQTINTKSIHPGGQA